MTAQELEALAAKLDQLDLTDREHEVLLSVFAAAGEVIGAEVSGFGINPCNKLGVNPCAKLDIHPCIKVGRPSVGQGLLGAFGFQH